MRLFIAVQLSEPVKDALCRGREELRRRARSGNFSRRENLHLTLAFLGELPPEALPRIRRAMERAAVAGEPFDLSLAGPGRFRRPGADLWWVGVEKTPALTRLAAALRQELKTAGLPVDDKPFSPHLTIARQVDAPGLLPEQVRMPAASQRVDRFSLMESARVKGVLTYTELFSQPLG